MHLSHQKGPSKFTKSIDVPTFGRPTRSPRTPSTSLQSYSDTFEESSQQIPNYSDSFISEQDEVSCRHESNRGERTARTSTTEVIPTVISDHRHHRTSTYQTLEVPTERLDTVISDYIETERPLTVTVGIETCISEIATDQIHTITERVESQLSETEKLHSLSSPSPTHAYTYSDTFQSTLSSGEKHVYDDDFTGTNSKSDETATRSEYSNTHTVDYSRTSASGSLTDETVSKIFEEYTLSSEITEREYSSEFEEESKASEYDYSSQFEATDSQDTEKIEREQREEEERRQAAEARDNFVSAMVSNIKQRPFREMDIEELIDKEIEGIPEEEDLPPEKVRFLKKKMHVLKKKRGKGDSPAAPEVNLWDSQKEKRITDYGLHPAIMEKLKLKNFIMSMEKAAKEDFHDPKKCRDCRDHEMAMDSAAAHRNFVRIKTRDTRQRTMEENYHKHLVKMDSINLIADIARSLPRPTDDAQDIGDRLFKGLHLSKSITQNRIGGV